jgi:hypothetical protein
MADFGMMQTAWNVTDYPDPPYRHPVFCPVCGNECDWIYENELGEVVGCDGCLSEMDAYEWANQGEM